MNLKVLRKPEVLATTGWSRSTLHVRIKENLFVPPISLGERAIGFLAHETDAVLAAMISGKSKEQIKALVASLVAQRKNEGATQ
ncbi:MAG: AlpA family phage regulatory protein [Cellvibrio sp.]|nr:AlpA family phage regulatory protein [Cellvibrio sp.]